MRMSKTIGLVLVSVPGYSETFLRHKIDGLQSRGFKVVLFVTERGATTDMLGCKVVYAPNLNQKGWLLLKTYCAIALKAIFKNPLRSFKHLYYDTREKIPFLQAMKRTLLNQYLFSEQIDWLHFGFGMLAIKREHVAQAIGAKMAVSFRGADLYLSPLKHPGCYDLLFKKEVSYHVLSQAMKKTLRDYGISESCITVIPPAIDVNFFSRSQEIKSDLPLTFLTVARLHWKKGLEYTLEALAILKTQQVSFRYHIVGAGDQYERLAFAVHQLGLENEVCFEGRLSPSAVKSLMQRTAIYLQYSIQEGFCNAVLEAQAMGLLCIVSNAEGLPENVIHGKTGWVVAKRSPKDLVEQIKAAIALTKSDKNIIKNNAMERVYRHFNLKDQQAAFADFYSK